MERLKCKACGCYSLLPMEVAVEDDDGHLFGEEQESRFYSCHVCGDNWLSLKETDDEGSCTITFVHQMGMSPTLKRTAYMQTPIVIKDNTVEAWQYFVGEEEIDKSSWQETLKERRHALRSMCMN